MKNNDKGITLVALIVTIIVLIILAGVSIGGAVTGNQDTKEHTLFSELKMVQNIILQRKTKVNITKQQNDLPGTKIEKEEVQTIITQIDPSIILKGKEYKRITQEELKQLGISNTKNTYIICYETGETINETIKKTESGKALYIYSKNE